MHITGPLRTLAPAARSQILLDQADMIQRLNLRTVAEPTDQADVTARYEALLKLHAGKAPAIEARQVPGGKA